MMYTGSCPKCGAVIRGGHGTPIKRIDSPIQFCPKCNSPYLDGNMYEWNILSAGYKLRFYFWDNNRVWLHFLCLCVALVRLANEQPMAWPIFFGLEAVVFIACYVFIQAFNKDNFSKSYLRTADPAYVSLLAEIGYDKMSKKHLSSRSDNH